MQFRCGSVLARCCPDNAIVIHLAVTLQCSTSVEASIVGSSLEMLQFRCTIVGSVDERSVRAGAVAIAVSQEYLARDVVHLFVFRLIVDRL